MEKGFTLKSFLIIAAIIVVMILIAFFVQREKAESPEPEEEAFYENEENRYDIDSEGEESVETEEIRVIDSERETDSATEDIGPVVRAKENLSQSLEIGYNDIVLVKAEETVFSDYTLGTSRPGEVYPQNPVNGYIVILSHNGQEYRYHASADNLFFIE